MTHTEHLIDTCCQFLFLAIFIQYCFQALFILLSTRTILFLLILSP
jgi:hypothetical protein